MNCYYNAIKFVPEALLQLQNLTHLCLRFVQPLFSRQYNDWKSIRNCHNWNMNDILKVEMLMIEVRTLKCKIEIFSTCIFYVHVVAWGRFTFLDICIVNGIIQLFQFCFYIWYSISNFRTCIFFYIWNSGLCTDKLATSQTVYNSVKSKVRQLVASNLHHTLQNMQWISMGLEIRVWHRTLILI